MKEKKPKKLYQEYFDMMTPFANFPEDATLIWTMYDQYMEFEQAGNNENSASMDYRQLTDADYYSQKETVTEHTNMIGSAIKGSLIWGQTGAMIGAMKAMHEDGKKEETKVFYYVSLTYIGSDNEEHVIVLEDFNKKKKGLDMVNRLREMLGKPTIVMSGAKPPTGHVQL